MTNNTTNTTNPCKVSPPKLSNPCKIEQPKLANPTKPAQNKGGLK